MSRVLILGNGVSRERYNLFIQEWSEDLWVCNSAYFDFWRHPFLRHVTTDRTTAKEVVRHKREKSLSQDIFVTRSTFSVIDAETKKDVIPFEVDEEFQTDSGTTSVVAALNMGYDVVYLCGFDLGGKDLYVPNHEKKVKTIWVDQWRKIADKFSLSKIFFVGKNHTDFILSDKPADYYASMYTHGRDHTMVEGEESVHHGDEATPNYLDSTKVDTKKKRKKVLILGNGVSRLRHKDFIRSWDGEVWVCNWAFKESDNLPKINRVGSVHENVIKMALSYRKQKNLDYRIFSSKPYYKSEVFAQTKGWATGSLMLQQALIEDYTLIVLAGFDMGGKDIYQPSAIPGSNFRRQYVEIRRKFDLSNVFFLQNELTPARKVRISE